MEQRALDEKQVVDSAKSFVESIFAGDSSWHDADDHKLFNTENNHNARTFLNGQHMGEMNGER